MKQYNDLVQRVLQDGNIRRDRTGTGTMSVFGHQMRFDLSEGFPLITTKKVHMKSIIHELLWFLKGDTNIKYLQKNGVKIWDAWANKYGELGAVYGEQWRSWWCFDDKNRQGFTIDQIANVIDSIKNNPNSRRHIVSAWNVEVLPDESLTPQENVEQGLQALPPCHCLFQFYVNDGKLSCQLYQRSADIFLGVPFNIASYALLTHMIAQVCGLEVGEFIHTFGDAHIYSNHIKQLELQMSREDKPLPTIKINSDITNIDDFKYEDFELVGYDPHPAIKGEIAI